MFRDRALSGAAYTARAGFAAGPTNNLIHNFKKGVARRGRPEWRHKERCISEAAAAFRAAINPQFLTRATLVPVPPSKGRDDPRYDDRLVRMLQQMADCARLDMRELLQQRGTREAAAHDGIRPGPDELAALYQVDETVARPAPTLIAIFDDLLVTGASFVAARRVLTARFPNCNVFGFFLARRALPGVADVAGEVEI
jgi:predicted amidophosphoribosyltransferase